MSFQSLVSLVLSLNYDGSIRYHLGLFCILESGFLNLTNPFCSLHWIDRQPQWLSLFIRNHVDSLTPSISFNPYIKKHDLSLPKFIILYVSTFLTKFRLSFPLFYPNHFSHSLLSSCTRDTSIPLFIGCNTL